MSELQLFAQILKADEERHEVTGVLAAEVPDRSGEILDYSASKPKFVKWIKSQLQESQGKSFGNVRRMHQLDAVGKLMKVWFDDVQKRVVAIAKITDPRTWNDIKEGVLTGFSIGGKYASRSKTDPRKYAAEPFEVSVVDRPCIPGATFSYIRADGAVELRKFVGPSNVKEFTDRPADSLPRQGETGEQPEWGDLEAAGDDPKNRNTENQPSGGVQQDKGGENDPYLDDRQGATLAQADKEPYGDVEYADPGYQSDKKKRYPVDTEENVRAAWSYINQAKNSGKYSSEQLAHIKGKIKAAAKRHGVEVSEKAVKTNPDEIWDTGFEEKLMEELEKIENDLEKGTRKKASQKARELADMHKAQATAFQSALEGFAKSIAGPDSAQSEGNSMQSRSGEMTDQARPAIAFNPQEPTAIGKLAKRLGVTEDSLRKAVDETNSESSSGLTASDVTEIVQKSMMDVFEKLFGAPQPNEAVRGPGAGAVKVTKDQDNGGTAAKTEDELPPPPGIDPRMQEIYRAAGVTKAQGTVPVEVQMGLSKVHR